MKTYKILYYLLFFTFVSGQVNAQYENNDIQEVLRLGDLRSFGEDDKLLDYLDNSNEQVVITTLNVLSNVGDSTKIEAIAELLMNNTSPNIREAAAFALGQIGGKASSQTLLNALNAENDINVVAAILEALGKTGDINVLTKIPESIISGEDYRGAVAMAIARFALRNSKDQNSISILNSLSSNGVSGDLEKYIAYALWRIRDRDLLMSEREKIVNLLSSSDPETRSYAVNAFNAIKTPDDIPFIAEIYNKETDWRVKVNILNSLGSYSLDSIKGFEENLLSIFNEGSIDISDHVKIAALNSMGRMFSQFNNTGSGEKPVKIPGTDIAMRIIGAGGWFHPEVKAAAVDAYAKIMKDDAKKVLFEEFYHSTSTAMDEAIVNGFRNFENGDIIRELRDSISAFVLRYNELNPNTTGEMIPSPVLGRVYRAYIETAAALLPKMKSEESLNLARLSFIEFADSRKPDIVYYSLEGLKTEQMRSRENWMFENKEVLNFEYAGFEYPEDVDVMTLFADAFGELQDTAMVDELRKNLSRDSYELAKASADAINKITGETITVNPADFPKHTDFDWTYLAANSNTKAILKTEQGDVEVEFYTDAAPFTVMNFLKLAEKDYFDSTLFHRVIGNFVVQGGDPTGTGFGGPGYSIRAEYNNIPYERGTLGMASSGKDTEGSQFFITHSRTPHLDGKYTVFGQVTKGMEIVDIIMQDDMLLDVIVIR